MSHRTRVLLSSALLASPVAAQAVAFSASPAVAPGGQVDVRLAGPANRAYAIYADVSGGPRSLVNLNVYLGLTPSLTLVRSGVIPLVGRSVNVRLPVPATGVPAGLTVYFQSAVAAPTQPLGIVLSDGETSTVYRSSRVMAEKFSGQTLWTFAGDFDRTVTQRLMAGAVTWRTAQISTARWATFGQPIAGEFYPRGARVQKVYRANDLGATGQREVLTGMSWEIFRGRPIVQDVYPRMVIEVANSDVVPDYTIDSGSALPKFPNSGLKQTFASNPSGPKVKIHDGSYTMRPGDVDRGYLPYPKPSREFVYDGKSSLLIDISNYPSAQTRGWNGQQIFLPVTSSPRPDSRVFKRDTMRPEAETQADAGDNSITGMRFEFAQVFSEATSPWRPAPTINPDYHQPYLGASVPAGASIEIDYRGASSASGDNPTAWSTQIDVADGRPFLQYRVRFRSATNGARASLDSLVIPVD